MNVVCKNIDDVFMFGFPNKTMQANGHEISNKQCFFVAPNETVHTIMPENFSAFGIALPREVAEQVLSKDLLEVIELNAEAIRQNTIELPFLEELKAYLNNVYLSIPKTTDVLSISDLAEVEHALIGQLKRILEPLKSTNGNIKHKRCVRKSIVDRALKHLEETSTTTTMITIPELAKHCFCSTRALIYAFKQYYNVSPKGYLMLRRLHMVREAIIQNQFDTFKELTVYFEISNAGRTSQEYYLLFGEYPRDTISKNQS